ncbi:MAG: thiamine pyrophosphate-binding protein, partial [Proteobacteria bacterium]|nr:thiamine pyrophosphate-binding protein [Pseudomonadota bacterium]
PGLGNGIGMMYGALRAGSPMIVTAGQQDTRLRLDNPVLGHDLVAMAAPVSKWSVQVERADEMAPIMRRAFKIANDGFPGPVFVALPIDVMEQETTRTETPKQELWRASLPDPRGIARIAEMLLAAEHPAIVVGDDAARAGATAELVRLAETVGASVWHEGLRMHVPFPSAHPSARHGLPLDAAAIAKTLGNADMVLLIGGSFFEHVWWAGASPFPNGVKVAQIEASAERLAFAITPEAGLVGCIRTSLKGLVEGLDRAASPAFRDAAKKRNADLANLKAKENAFQKTRAEKGWDREPTSMPRAMAEIRDALPANAIVVDESITASIDLMRTLDFAKPGTYFGAKGGGIGQGIAGALGVSVAKPKQPICCISGDGSAMYAIQSLWTAAHLDLPIVFVILANAEYRILKHNIDVYRQRFEIASQEPYAHMDLASPRLGFVEMAAGMGVASTRVTKPTDIGPALKSAFASKKPHLVEIAVEAKR